MADPLRRRVRARILRGLTLAVGHLPDPVLDAVLSGLAGAARFTKYESLARANLARALGNETTEAERTLIARGVRRHAARLAREWARLARGASSAAEAERNGRWIDATVELDPSVARIDEQYARGRGVLIATAHLGNWEMLCAALQRRGLRGAVIGLRKRRDPSADWLLNMRRAYGVETLPQDAPARQVLEVLRSGGTIGLLCDLEVRRIAGEFVPFFDMPALTMTAPAALARAARLPIVPVRCVLRGERYVLSVDEPLELDRTLDHQEARINLTARLNQVFERWIRETPEQWTWYQDRWRTRPGERTAPPLASRRPARRDAAL